jgi:filamentous hemagglutinin family protein
MLISQLHLPSQPATRQKPLVIAIQALIAGSVALGSGVSPVRAQAHSPIPVGSDMTTVGQNHSTVTTLEQNQTVNLNPTYGTATETLQGHTLTIDTSNTAIINWNSFNINSGYTVKFVEPTANSVVLNNIGDQNASTIIGTLTSNGQVYLVNQNGFLFEHGSQVNVNSLVATSLGISQESLLTGIANVFTTAVTNNASTAVATGAALQAQDNGHYLQDVNGNYVLDGSGNKIPITLGSITVNSGASITTNAAGGLILLAGANVNNRGVISANNGQVILAAAKDKVYLKDSSDPNLRGMLVEVGYGGQTTNDSSGVVLAQTGNISMIGFAVNQDGIASASTSVSLNGSVRLLAEEGVQNPSNTGGKLIGNTTQRSIALNDNLPQSLGTNATVTLEAGSITSVGLDTSNATAIAANTQPKSQIEISGHNINMQNGSLVQAHSGTVNVNAWETPEIFNSAGALTPTALGTASINLQSGSLIDVSGVDVSESMSANVISIKLQSNELANSPTQRNGVLYGTTDYVDLRDATIVYDSNGSPTAATVPIANIIGSVETIAGNIAERSTAGGIINLSSTGDVIVNAGSTLNFSGGSVAYQSGDITVTELISAGQVYNIGTANPNLIYSGIFNQTIYQQGYVQGAAGGNLNITSYSALLDGTLQGSTTNGAEQRQASSWATGSTLNINLLSDNTFIQQDVVFSNSNSGMTITPTGSLPVINDNQSNPVALNINTEMLKSSGIQNLTINGNGAVTVDKGAQLQLAARGSLNLNADGFNILGSIEIPSGSVSLNDVGSGIASNEVSGNIALGSSGKIDVSGLWVNDWLDISQGNALGALAINAGSVSLTAQGNIELAAGSQITADGGAWKQLNDSVTAGKAGSISLNAGNLEATNSLGSQLTAYGLQNNGALNLVLDQVVIGNQAPANPSQTLQLDGGFFQTGGFSSYNITSSVNGLTVENNFQLTLQQQNFQLFSSSDLAATGTHLSSIAQPVVLAESLRKPVNLALSYTGPYYQGISTPIAQYLTIGSGASIQTDPGATVSLESTTSIFIDGSIYAPAGSISASIIQPLNDDPGYIASQGIWLGAESKLLATGATVPQLSAYNLNIPDVLAGGSVSLNTVRGYIVAEAGSLINVYGTSSQGVASAGGSISLTSPEGIIANGGFEAWSGGGNAAGGSLSVSLDSALLVYALDTNPFPKQPSTLVITTATSLTTPSEGASVNAAYADQAWLTDNSLNTAGFAAIKLQSYDNFLTNGQLANSILFEGNVSLTASEQITLDAPTLATSASNEIVTINAPYVALGSTRVNQEGTGYVMDPPAVTGSGQFTVNAQGIDLIGGLSFNGFDQVNLFSQGDLRMIGEGEPTTAKIYYLGELDLQGNLNIAAKRVYPATLTEYTMNVSGTATFQNGGSDTSEVLSADGNLIVNANDIIQQGDLTAPFGAITLNATDTLTLADGSNTSVSAAGAIIPFGVGSASSIWLYPVDNSGTNNLVIYDKTVDNVPQKILTLNGQSVDLQHGATINLSGGGDLYAYEFVSGSGGTNDILSTPDIANGSVLQFAVLPGIDNILTPYDPQQFTGSGLSMGESVYLNAAAGLTAGWYTLLPAHYALLPGAFLITPEAGTAGQSQTTYDAAGYAVVSGRYGVAGTSIQNSVTQGFEVQSGSIFTGSVSYNSAGGIVSNPGSNSPSQFNAYLASATIPQLAALYGNVVPQLPQDAGGLVFDATTSLTLDARLLAAPTGKGLGGRVDITGSKLEVIGNSNDSVLSGYIGLQASQLNAFNAPSLLLGGQRNFNSRGEVITVTANNVLIASDVENNTALQDFALQGPEILLAATNQVTLAAANEVNVGTGAQVLSISSATGDSGGSLLVENPNGSSDGALVRVSTSGQSVVDRDLPITGNGGLLTIGSGAVLGAEGSILLDSSQNTVFNGNINMTGTNGSLELDASQISIGNAPANTPGLVLASLPGNLNQLILNSTGDLNLYGTVNLSSNSVEISAASINGFANGYPSTNQTANIANITATTQLELSNSTGAVSVNGNATAYTGSTLQLMAQNIILGSGNYGITGFQNINLTAHQTIEGQGATINSVTGDATTAAPGVLTVTGDTTLTAEYFSGGNGATTTINAENNTVKLISANTPASYTEGLGVSWTIDGGTISSSAFFALPSGSLSMTATSGDINLNSGNYIDLSGRFVNFAGTDKYSAGGNLNLRAAAGNVNAFTGSTINLAGYINPANSEEMSNAGSLNILANAGNGLFNWGDAASNWNAVIDAGGSATALASGVTSGNFQLNASGFGASGFSTLYSKLASAGFGNNLVLEQQAVGDVTISDNVTAGSFQLNVDQGAVILDSTINVSGVTAGSVSIYGANGITMDLNSQILAEASGAQNTGGKVTLDAGTGTLDLSATHTDSVTHAVSSTTINVSGGSDGNGGSVLLRANTNFANSTVDITQINTQIIGAAPFSAVLEANQVYAKSGDYTITATDITGWSGAVNNFMSNQSAITDSTGNALSIPNTLLLMPGLEVSSTGNLTLAANWNFESGGTGWSSATSSWNSGWRYGALDLPGFLTLKAAGDLNINASISDGVATTPVIDSSSAKLYANMIQPGLSWSYDLIAGGNVNLAASYLVNGVDTQVVVRTGTGDIQVQAGGNIVLNIDTSGSLGVSNDASAIYTVGSTANYNTIDLPALNGLSSAAALAYIDTLSQSQLNQALRYGLLPEASIGSSLALVEYPTQGGNISLTAGGNIQGQQTGQQIADWLVSPAKNKIGNYSAAAWGINITGGDSGNTVTNDFNQNIGALGGGNVTVNAGGNISDLSVMIPTTGKPLGSVNSLSPITNIVVTNHWLTSETYINGGGNLQLSAGNNIYGGEFYVAQGTANLSAGGGFLQDNNNPSSTTIGAILDVGNAVFNLQARNDLELETAMSPTTLLANSQATGSVFFSYGADSAVNLQSAAGNVVILNNTTNLQALKNLSIGSNGGSSNASFALNAYPGILNAVALSGDLRIDNPMTLFPSSNGSLQLLANGNIGIDAAAVALLGSNNLTITMSDVNPSLLPGVSNPTTSLNNSAANVSTYLNTSNGVNLLANQLLALDNPNTALIVANQGNIDFPSGIGASINLPTAADIIADGNLNNLTISTQNQTASDVTLVEAGGSINYDTTYESTGVIQPNSGTATGITVAGPGTLQVLAGGNINLGSSTGIDSIGNQNNPDLSTIGATIDALAGISGQINTSGFINKYITDSAYTSELQGQPSLDILLNVMFQEIQLSAYAAASAPQNQRYNLYQQGFEAINTLFPSASYSGSINMVFSQIMTENGGNINLVVPGGAINVGLAGAQGGNTKGADQLGILVQQAGDLNILTQGDMNVNQSRVFTEGDGNITAWSSAGSIDAGKGARSALSPSIPTVNYSVSGQILINFSPTIAGSGIQAVGGGNVYLAAPVGTVNAGEAGISGKDIVIAAVTVLGQSNISASGTTVGVPTASAPVVGLAGADSAAAGASKSGAQTLAEDSHNNTDANGKQKSSVSILSTDLVGFGKCSVSDVKSAASGCGG